jgi:hypothetical protein
MQPRPLARVRSYYFKTASYAVESSHCAVKDMHGDQHQLQNLSRSSLSSALAICRLPASSARQRGHLHLGLEFEAIELRYNNNLDY